MTYLSVAARIDSPGPGEWLVEGATLIAADNDSARLYVLAEVPVDLLAAQEARLPEHRRVARGDTLALLHTALCVVNADLAETDLVMRAMYERGEDSWTATIRGVEALRDRLRLLDIAGYGEPDAVLLDEVLDLLRTHALPEDHPLANL